MNTLGCKVGSVNIDSTSFHYHGREQVYHEDNSKVDYDEPHKINVTYGYSRDAHPELVQVMEQMMVDNATGIPLYMEPESILMTVTYISAETQHCIQRKM